MGMIETLLSEEFEIDFSLEEVKCKIHESLNFPHSNSKYLAGTEFLGSKYLELFDISSDNNAFNLETKYSIYCRETITDLDFHSKYTSLIASSLCDGKINIYEIKDKNNKDINKPISEINAFDSYIQNILFNPYRDEIFSSCTNEQLKLFDLTKYTYLKCIPLDLRNKFRTVLKWKSDNLFAYSINKGIIIDNYKSSNSSDKITITCNEIIKDFFFCK
jgi:WD40 repeat protein